MWIRIYLVFIRVLANLQRWSYAEDGRCTILAKWCNIVVTLESFMQVSYELQHDLGLIRNLLWFYGILIAFGIVCVICESLILFHLSHCKLLHCHLRDKGTREIQYSPCAVLSNFILLCQIFVKTIFHSDAHWFCRKQCWILPPYFAGVKIQSSISNRSRA